MSPDWAAKEDPVPYATFDDPQSLNLYAYVRNNPLTRVDADGHVNWNDVGNFLVGASNALKSDLTFGSGRMEQTTTSGQLGAMVGDAVATGVGAYEMNIGTRATLTGALTEPESNGAGVAVAAAGVAVTAHGATVVAQGAGHLAMAAKAGGRFSPGTKQGAKEAAGGKCQNCGTETTPGQKSEKGVTPPKNEGQTDHIEPASKGGTNAPSNAQHLCRECNIKKSNN